MNGYGWKDIYYDDEIAFDGILTIQQWHYIFNRT